LAADFSSAGVSPDTSGVGSFWLSMFSDHFQSTNSPDRSAMSEFDHAEYGQGSMTDIDTLRG